MKIKNPFTKKKKAEPTPAAISRRPQDDGAPTAPKASSQERTVDQNQINLAEEEEAGRGLNVPKKSVDDKRQALGSLTNTTTKEGDNTNRGRRQKRSSIVYKGSNGLPVAVLCSEASPEKQEDSLATMSFEWGPTVGKTPGTEIWRVENRRTINDNPDFGISSWPLERYGQFHRGDSYIILVTQKNPHSSERMLYDIYFWIGSESTQDEYGVAAYAAVNLDGVLGGEPVQHREVEGRETEGFMAAFPNGVSYLEGGIDGGFRKVSDIVEEHDTRLYRVYKKRGEKTTGCFEVPLSCSSLNDGDAFLLDAGNKIYTWFGSTANGYEKNKSASVAQNLKESRVRLRDRSSEDTLRIDCELILDIGNNNEEFWKLLGGRGEIKPAEDETEVVRPFISKRKSVKMFVVPDLASGGEKVERYINRLYRVYKKPGEQTTRCFEVPLACSSLNDGDAFLLDAGNKIYTWFGSTANAFEKNKSASVAQNMKEKRLKIDCELILDVMDNNEEFWQLLGGKGEIKPAEEAGEVVEDLVEKKMFVVSDATGSVKVTEVPFKKCSLISDDVCIVDAGNNAYVWIGKGSTQQEKRQSMVIAYRYLKDLGRNKTTSVTRVMEGQEARCQAFLAVF